MIKIPSHIKFQTLLHSGDGKKYYNSCDGILFNGYKSVIIFHKKCGYTVYPSTYCNCMHFDNNIENFTGECQLLEILKDKLKPGDWFVNEPCNFNFISSYKLYLGNNKYIYVNAKDSIIKEEINHGLINKFYLVDLIVKEVN